MAQRFLITGTMSRTDILDMFRPLVASAQLAFVEYERNWGQGFDRSVYQPFGDLFTWEESRSADALVRRVQPDLVVLLFTSSLNQVALRAAARDRGIATVHVEHGYRLPAADSLPARLPAERASAARR